MHLKSITIILLLLAACSINTGSVVLNTSESADIETGENVNLYVDPAPGKQLEFEKKLKATGTITNKRALYEEYLDVIGANGILKGIDKVYSGCHSQAHDAGKVIFAKVKDISTALRICGDACYTGCMHGVLMEAFKGAQGNDEYGHIDADKLKAMLQDICSKNKEMQESYGPGECAHGVGHALMFLNGYNIRNALNACADFNDQKMEYYCADGGYMEYDVVREADDVDKGLWYPCDTFDYPATCMRTKVGLVGKRLDKVGLDLVKECEKLDGKVRLGCFHGIGTSHAKIFVLGKLNIKDICAGTHDEQIACIEGAAEFIGKYFADKVESVCAELDSDLKEACLAGGRHKLYSLDKDLSLYLN